MSTSCALDRIPVGYISSYSLVLVVSIDSLTSAWEKRQKYWAGFEGEFEKLKVDRYVCIRYGCIQEHARQVRGIWPTLRGLVKYFCSHSRMWTGKNGPIVVLPHVYVRTVDYQTREIRGQIMSASSNHAELVIELTSVRKFCSKVQRSPLEY